MCENGQDISFLKRHPSQLMFGITGTTLAPTISQILQRMGTSSGLQFFGFSPSSSLCFRTSEYAISPSTRYVLLGLMMGRDDRYTTLMFIILETASMRFMMTCRWGVGGRGRRRVSNVAVHGGPLTSQYIKYNQYQFFAQTLLLAMGGLATPQARRPAATMPKLWTT